tara:strand:- start:1412 stop:1645 length:234 start_codon:yes stop_codon:yes gene_type:complete
MGLSRHRADQLRKASVWVNVLGFCCFVAGAIIPAAALKIIAEAMRLPFFEHVRARDMTLLSVFFICGSFFAIIVRIS